MFTDKHYPPTFLSNNRSLRDMVKDRTDYDKRINEISTNFNDETKRAKEKQASAFQLSTTRSGYEHPNRSSSQFSYSTEPIKRPSSRGPSLYSNDFRIGEERAIRASQRRAMRHTPTRQIETNLTVRPNTPNILLTSTYGDHSLSEDSKSQIVFPKLSYGRITPSRDLFPTSDNSNKQATFNLHRPSAYYRYKYYIQYYVA